MELDVDVWFDEQGRIVAWGTPGTATDVGQVVPAPSAGLMTATVLIPAEHRDRLHETHRIDPKTKQLVIRDDAVGR